MRRKITLAHTHAILDACCVINLYASGRMAEILRSIVEAVMVAAYIRDVEATRIQAAAGVGGAGTDERIDLSTLIDEGLLTVVSPASEAEAITVVNFAAALGDDGEAFTGAIAVHRGWAIGSDDRRATNYLRSQAPHLPIISTPEFVKHWVDTEHPHADDVRAALENIQSRARYEPGPRHPLRAWWQAHC